MTETLKTRLAQVAKREIPQGYKRTKVGIVPKEWEVPLINDCLKKIGTPVEVNPTEEYYQIGIRSHGKGIFYKEKTTGEKLGNKKVFWITKDCLILNVVFAWEQAVAITTEQDVGKIGSHRFPMYTPIADRISIEYILRFFMTKRGKNILDNASPGGAGRNKTLGQTRFEESIILCPPLPEQQKIAKILATQDKIISLKERVLEQKEKQKKYLMQQLLTGKKRLEGFSGEWEKIPLGDVAKIYDGTHETPQYQNSGIPFVSVENIQNLSNTNKFISQVAFEKYKIKPQKNDILMTRIGSIGKTAIVTSNSPLAYYVSLSLIRPDFNVDSTFLTEIINNQAFKKELHKRIIHTAFPIKINLSDIGKCACSLPPLPEQQAIANILSTADKEISLLQQDLAKEKEKKKSLMQLLLTGIVRVNDG